MMNITNLPETSKFNASFGGITDISINNKQNNSKIDYENEFNEIIKKAIYETNANEIFDIE